MALDHRNGINLESFYNNHPGYEGNCRRTSTTRWWSSCYDGRETLYYFIRFLAIPLAGLVILFLIFLLLRDLFETPPMQVISLILTFIAYLFIATYLRERIRARRFEITVAQGLIDVYDPSSPLFNFTLNSISVTKYNIGFVGDIMMMREYDLQFHPEVIDFFRGVDLIVGNLEGIVTPTGDYTLSTQVHHINILSQLGRLLTGNTRWLLCLSNNHSIDFGNIEFHNSLDRIRPHFFVFGRNDTRNVLVNGLKINIATATRWSNKATWDCISRFYYVNENSGNGINDIREDNYFNILLPHWSYENERYVRDSVQSEANSLLTSANNSWDLIFGHHPHVRQPMVRVNDTIRNVNKLVVFSGGNFTSGVRFLRASRHLYGIIMKCKIGPLRTNPNQLAIGEVEWRRTYNQRDVVNNHPRKTVIIDTTEEPNPLRYAPYVFLFLIFAVIIFNILERFVF